MKIEKFLKNVKPRATFYVVVFAFLSTISVLQSLFYGNVIAKPRIQEELENVLYLSVDSDKNCKIMIKLLPDVAPNHVKRIKQLARDKFYDGVEFHRVIKGFMAQAGGKNGNPNYGSGKKINAEFSKMKHIRGAVSMARPMDVNGADSQFFIVTQDSPFLDGQYSIFGMVIEGMECVDKIKQGPESMNGMVSNPTKIISMRVAIDEEVAKAKANK
ncbi:peptidylprolyl isomerase [Candidatus Deianiraea vastatrix]|uniref:Peptidyl-prolyl cis-trans isomerase n=1 Tax=Candidatus Deianiraea vastatrix TaxID=2163644 RepID=A0A5B8XHW1_9RICK|nr:peptidylprolyl isomerase [Candidatus Deianiraea vastatrix]QED23357.1 Putative peptidyl-prolyl cis-trans isomerase [Candidatus Deianiraea vastatrix]